MSATGLSCFVIGPIGDVGSTIRRKADWILYGLVKPVLEAPEFGYIVNRADQDPNPGSVSDAMINAIFDADLVVADLTGFNPNALYELGIRHTFQKPAIHITADCGIKLPFDNQDQRTIEVDFEDFHHVELAKTALSAAVSYVQRENFKVSNPVTRALGFAALVASGDPRDVILANLQSSIESMADRLRDLESPIAPVGFNKSSTRATSNASRNKRFREYYKYIRDSVDKNHQVPFDSDVVSSALLLSSHDEFVDWYANYNSKARGLPWWYKLKSLDSESFKNLINNSDLMDSLTDLQAAKIQFQTNARNISNSDSDQ